MYMSRESSMAIITYKQPCEAKIKLCINHRLNLIFNKLTMTATKTVFFIFLTSLLSITSCKKSELEEVVVPTNLNVTTAIVGTGESTPNGDGSGRVSISVSATNAESYEVDFGDGNVYTIPSGSASYRYYTVGVNDYTIKVSAIGAGGGVAKATKSVKVLVSNKLPLDLVTKLTNNSAKVWVIDKDAVGHVGFGLATEFTPSLYQAAANTLSDCVYDDEVTFVQDGNNNIALTLDNKGNSAIIGKAASLYGLSGGDDCYGLKLNTDNVQSLAFAPASSNAPNSTKIQFTLSGNGLISIGTGAKTYEILSVTANSLVLRNIGVDGQAWYMKFKPKPADKTLFWAEEFNQDGVLNSSVWSYDIGNGEYGWGNAEKEYYTDRAKNITVKDGVLKITACKEDYSGFQYTSARIKSQNKFSFMYGRVDIRAKIPTGKGTWPTLWIMGNNIQTVGWPNCGEIDIMEARGSEPNKIYGMFHYPGRSGGNAEGGNIMIEDPYNQFHVYSMDWSPTTIKMYVDGNLYYTFNNNATLPYNQNFYFILNVAMGGLFGGDIDPKFGFSSMEVDYVRIYK